MTERKLTIEQISKANFLLQKLVNGVVKRQEGKGGINSYEAYDIIEEIHEVINGNEKLL